MSDRKRIENSDARVRAHARTRISTKSPRISSWRAGSACVRCSLLAAAQINGVAAADDVVRGGVSCELVHLGSLYHDDVMDEADTRRGVETVNAKWGNLQAILAGDFLLSRASEIAASLGTEVAGLLARTIGWLCEGQIAELRHTYDVSRPESSYFTSIHGKTASLYGTAARIGGIVAGHDRVTIDALTDFGNAYGMVFQIVDDILDITATDEQLGKPAGHDMVEGVYTLPVLRTLAASGNAARELADLLGSPLDTLSNKEPCQSSAQTTGWRRRWPLLGSTCSGQKMPSPDLLILRPPRRCARLLGSFSTPPLSLPEPTIQRSDLMVFFHGLRGNVPLSAPRSGRLRPCM